MGRIKEKEVLTKNFKDVEMILGILTRSLNLSNLEKLRSKDFNAIYFFIGWFYKPEKDIEEAQKKTVKKMLSLYEESKKLGYKHFLIDIGWGLGSYGTGNNYFYEKIIAAFNEMDDVTFYLGEPYEEFGEKFGHPRSVVAEIIKERLDLTNNNLIVDATARNIKEKFVNCLSSYHNQQSYWESWQHMAWVYGQWKLFADSNYIKLKDALRKKDINSVWLYQGDQPVFTWNSWLIWFQNSIGILERKEENKQSEFIKVFGK